MCEVQISASASHTWLEPPQVTPDRVCPEIGAGLGAVARPRAFLAGLWGRDRWLRLPAANPDHLLSASQSLAPLTSCSINLHPTRNPAHVGRHAAEASRADNGVMQRRRCALICCRLH